MKIKLYLLLTLIVALPAFGLFACTPKQTEQNIEISSPSTDATPSEEAALETESSSEPLESPIPEEEEKVLELFCREDFVPQEILDGFKAHAGIQVNVSNFESNEDMLATLEDNEGSGYDIIIASDYIVDYAIRYELAQALDKEQIPNANNIDPLFQGKYYDPENSYSIPYAASSPMIAYDPSLVNVDLNNCSDLWNPLLEHSIIFNDKAREIVAMVLQSIGQSINTDDPAVLEVANEKLKKLKNNAFTFTNETPQDALVLGDAPIGYLHSPQVFALQQERPDIIGIYPGENAKRGPILSIEALFIPIQAEHPSNAMAFINYILEGQQSALISETIGYWSCNTAAHAFLSEDYKDNLALTPQSEFLSKAEMIQDVGEADSIYEDMFAAFKS